MFLRTFIVCLPILGDLEHCYNIFTTSDIASSFVFLLNKLNELWINVNLSKLRDACIRDQRLSPELKKHLESADTVNTIINLLAKTPFCTWLEVRTLRSMADVAGVPKAIEIIDTFKSCVYSRKCSDLEVRKYLEPKYMNIKTEHLTLVKSKVNMDAEHIKVSQLIEFCHNLESILPQPVLVGSEAGCLEVYLVIPKHWHLHAYKEVKSHFFKLRLFNIQYLQIGTLPKVHTTDLTKMTEANLFLKSSNNISKFNNMHT